MGLILDILFSFFALMQEELTVLFTCLSGTGSNISMNSMNLLFFELSTNKY